MKKKILEYINRYQMMLPGDVVCIGLSGGADSVYLLLLLQELVEELFLKLQAVHVNHGFRGDESAGDQVFVEQLCKERGVPLFVYDRLVGKLTTENHMGLEEAWRMMRWQAYQECLERHGATKIALAHHQKDVAETLLFHLSRGTSLPGMAAIRPVNGAIIRPLLCISREEIEHDLNNRGIVWRTDSTNMDHTYTRNGIRHRVIFYLEGRVNKQAVRHMAEAAGDLEAAGRFLQEEALKRMKELVLDRENCLIILEKFFMEPEILQGYIVLECLKRLAGSRKDFTRSHVSMVRELMSMQTGKRICLPYGITGIRDYHGVCLKADEGVGSQNLEPISLSESLVPVGSSARFFFGKYEVVCGIYERNDAIIPKKAYTKWLDYNKIKNDLLIRTRQQGDFLVIDQNGRRKKLKDYMINQKIPRDERDYIPLLASGTEIFWVVGYRISENCKIDNNTRHVMHIQITEGNTYYCENADNK
ncbi:MAG: tRNA lysidine(34) synthetase TilS [Lachnospiraceae bacterium]|nr:tRNA lysidine(34) synthetase TilS [Lachnospiraceae bacterium]